MSSERRRNVARVTAGLLAGALALVAACADFSRGPPTPKTEDAGPPPGDGGGGGDGGGTLSFATDVYPLLVPTCEACHKSGGQAGDTGLVFTGTAATDYPTVIMFVDTSAPPGSRLVTKMTGNGHQGGTVYAAGSPEHQTILQWIQQGARE
jgi:hypothetical protein